jgi:hypothetical protein
MNAGYIADSNSEANEVVTFYDGRMAPKNESLSYEIAKKLFIAFLLILVIGSLIFKEFLLAGEPVQVWICLIIALLYFVNQGGHERVRCQSQLLFYNDYMIFFVPKHHIKRGKEQMEIQKIYYKDVTVCKYRTVVKKMTIFGLMEEVNYKYDKNGNVSDTACFHKVCNGIIKFYTVFDSEHDFKSIIERNTPLKVEFENS